LKSIYFAFVHPHLLYGIEIYANTSSTHLNKLETLNNKRLHISELSMGWVNPRVGLGWVGLGWVEIFLIFGWLGRGSETAETQKN